MSLRAWADDLLLDELTFKVRREVIDELESAGLWPNKAKVRRITNDQRAHGQAFVDHELSRWLTVEDFAWINSESIFGLSNYRLRDRLPMLIGFGYELGAGLHAWLGCQARTRNIATELGAAFNLGIVLFDLVCDELPDGAGFLATVFDAARLRELFTDRDAGRQLLASPVLARSPELRILFKIVVRFFDTLRAHAPSSSSPELSKAMELAFHAQLSTLRPGACSLAEIEQKSALPFVIIARAVRACCAPEGPTDVWGRADELVGTMGRVFWLIDDLADLCVDLSTGAVNGVAMRAATGNDWSVASVARRLLSSSLLAEVAREFRRELQRLVDNVASRQVRTNLNWTFDEFLLVRVRRWIQMRR
jgi:hypothetical protein